jgi:hypothetical protein
MKTFTELTALEVQSYLHQLSSNECHLCSITSWWMASVGTYEGTSNEVWIQEARELGGTRLRLLQQPSQ